MNYICPSVHAQTSKFSGTYTRIHILVEAHTQSNTLYECAFVFELMHIDRHTQTYGHTRTSINHHHRHQVMLIAQIPLTLSLSLSLTHSHTHTHTHTHSPNSFLLTIASDASSRLHLVSARTRCMQEFASRPTRVCLCIGVHWRTLLMSWSLLHHPSPACLLRL